MQFLARNWPQGGRTRQSDKTDGRDKTDGQDSRTRQSDETVGQDSQTRWALSCLAQVTTERPRKYCLVWLSVRRSVGTRTLITLATVSHGNTPEHAESTPERPWNDPGTPRNTPEHPGTLRCVGKTTPEQPRTRPRNTETLPRWKIVKRLISGGRHIDLLPNPLPTSTPPRPQRFLSTWFKLETGCAQGVSHKGGLRGMENALHIQKKQTRQTSC